MKRLQKQAYSYSELLLERLKQRYPNDYFQEHSTSVRKIGSAESEDEQINVNIEYYFTKEDVEYMTDMEISEEQWDDFGKYMPKAISRINDFDDMISEINYDGLADVKRQLPNEDVDSYELEYFKFTKISQDYSDVTFKLEARLIKY